MYLFLFDPAKLQVKPNTPTKRRASKTPAAKEAESTPSQTNAIQDSELPGPSVQPKASDEVVTEPQKGSGDHGDVENETLTGGKEDSISGAQTTQRRGASRQPR